jgi:nucleoside-diphosphate-sugar epimerase
MALKLQVPLSELEASAAPAKVCVTGASGYVAGEIIFRLLLAGHTVHGTVRGDPQAKAYDGLRALPHASERLLLFKANLANDGDFDEAIKGCDFVMHVASPVSVSVPAHRAEAELVRPAVKGVENVISAIEKSGSVKALVYTSSSSTVAADNWERGKDYVYSDKDWSESASLSFFPYALSKKAAERRACELYEAQFSNPDVKRPWRLVRILPSFVMGPPIGVGNSELVQFAVRSMSGKAPMLPNFHFPMVHISDVAIAHIHAMLLESATGRYILVEGNASRGMFDLVHKLKQTTFQNYPLPRIAAPKWLLWPVCNIFKVFPWDLVVACLNKPIKMDGSVAPKELQFEYHDPEEGLRNLFIRVVELGLVQKRGEFE